jgi:hypothetical protein
MDLSPHNFVSVDEILSDVLKLVNDSSFKLNSKGWYTSQIQQALEELSFDTFFDERNESFDIPDNLRLDMPRGAFNLRQGYLFNGDNCVIENSVPIYSKRNFINSNSGNGYVANDKFYNGNDRFHMNRGQAPRDKKDPSNLYFFGMQNGVIMLSESCRSFQKIMLVYNGVMTDIGEVPIVPQFFRQAVKDWVSVKALEMKLNDVVATNEYSHWNNLYNRYENSLNKPYDGSWAKAEHRSKQMNAKERQDIKMYFQRMRY